MDFDKILEGIYDEEGNLLEQEYNPNLGKIETKLKETIHHDAIEGVEEQGHWETIAEYPNGGKDVEWAIDVEGVEAREAWDEKIGWQVFIPYTKEELKAIEEEKNKPTVEQRLDNMDISIKETQNEINSMWSALLMGVSEA